MEEIINTFGIKWELMLFQALNFGVLLFLLHRYLYRPILKVVAERESHIKKGMKDAERASRELKSAEEERRHILTQGHHIFQKQGCLMENTHKAQIPLLGYQLNRTFEIP